jgi:hypothetical protein
VANGKRQFLHNIRDDNFLLILQYFHKFNIQTGRVVQLIGLQPSSAASFTLLNTYILSQLICGYKNLLDSSGVDTKDVYKFLNQESILTTSVVVVESNNFTFKVPNDLLKSDSRKSRGKNKRIKLNFDSFFERIKFNYQFWSKHPDFVWQVVFPALYKDVFGKGTNKNLYFLHSAVLREGSLHILCTDTRRHTARAKADEYAADDIGGGYHFRHFLKYKVCFASVLLIL